MTEGDIDMNSEATGGLSLRHEAFCVAYVETGNASESARRAGYSPRSAGELGSRLLRNVEIKQRIEELQSERLAERRALLQALVQPAVEALAQIIAGEAPRGATPRVTAALGVLDRCGLAATQKVETTGQAGITIVLSQDDMRL